MPFEDTLYMLDSAIRLSFTFEKAMTYFVVIVIIIILIPIVCCIVAACGAKAILEGDIGKTHGHNQNDPLLVHHNEVHPPPPNQAYMGYPPDPNYGNYPPPPVYQPPNYPGGAYYPPPPPPQEMQYGFPEASAPPLPK